MVKGWNEKRFKNWNWIMKLIVRMNLETWYIIESDSQSLKLVKVIVNQSGQANHSHLCRWSDKHRFLFLSLTQQWIRNRCFQRKHQEFFSVHRTAEAFEKCVEMYICFNVAAFSSFSHTLRLFLPFDGYLPKTLGAAAAADVEAWPCTTM